MTLDEHRKRLQNFKTEGLHSLAYVDEGEGPVVLLLHGVPTSSYLYRKIIPILTASGFRVIAPDLLGYGASDKPKGYVIYDHALQAKRVTELMDYLDIDRWHHVCHDMGGWVTWELLKNNLKRITHLTLLNTIIYPEGFCPPIKFKNNSITRWYSKLYCSRLLGQSIISSTFKNGLSDQHKMNKDELKAYFAPMTEGSSYALNYFFSRTGTALPDFSGIIRKIEVPVNVIWGMKDEILVWSKQSQRFLSDLASAHTNVIPIPDCKHFIPEERPALIAATISGLPVNN